MKILALLAALTSCAPAYRDVKLDVPLPPAATGVTLEQLRFPGHDGLALVASVWRPEPGTERGIVVLHHGLADHAARYAAFANKLARSGYTVWALDMRGHGRSSGRRVTVDRIDELVADLDAFVALVRARTPNAPLFLFGHSLGGLVTALYTIERQPDVAGVVLSAPGIAFDLPAFGVGVIRFVSALAPNAPVLSTPHDDFSTSRDVIADMKRDPLIEAPTGPARTSRSAVDGVRRVWAHPERFAVPLLAVHGTGDKVVAPIASRELVARAGTTDRTLRLYDDLQHDLLHEPDGDRVATDILAWLDAHVAGTPAPFASAPYRELRGDRLSMALAVELDARGERSDADTSALTGGLRLRLGIGRVGYAAGLDVRAGYLDGAYVVGELHAAGVAARTDGGASVAVTSGAGLRRASGQTATYVPIEVALELPLGPLHLLARGAIAYQLTGEEITDDAFGIADDARALLGVRFGRDHRYWPGTVAGAGPFLAATYQNSGGVEVLGVALGGQLWGGN